MWSRMDVVKVADIFMLMGRVLLPEKDSSNVLKSSRVCVSKCSRGVHNSSKEVMLRETGTI